MLETRDATLTMSVKTIINETKKKGLRRTHTPKNPKSDILQYLKVAFFCKCFLWFRDPRHSILVFLFIVVFGGALSLSKNSWKCTSVLQLRGLIHLKLKVFLGFLIIFEVQAVIFEARTVIFEARGAIWTILGIIVIFDKKRS